MDGVTSRTEAGLPLRLQEVVAWVRSYRHDKSPCRRASLVLLDEPTHLARTPSPPEKVIEAIRTTDGTPHHPLIATHDPSLALSLTRPSLSNPPPATTGQDETPSRPAAEGGNDIITSSRIKAVVEFNREHKSRSRSHGGCWRGQRRCRLGASPWHWLQRRKRYLRLGERPCHFCFLLDRPTRFGTVIYL